MGSMPFWRRPDRPDCAEAGCLDRPNIGKFDQAKEYELKSSRRCRTIRRLLHCEASLELEHYKNTVPILGGCLTDDGEATRR